MVGGRSVGSLQAGNGQAEQDVHEEGLGLLLLDPERHEGLVALVGKEWRRRSMKAMEAAPTMFNASIVS